MAVAQVLAQLSVGAAKPLSFTQRSRRYVGATAVPEGKWPVAQKDAIEKARVGQVLGALFLAASRVSAPPGPRMVGKPANWLSQQVS
ncbi:MAG: hypothetical protein IPJ94_16735 [Chloroflexi bacterium]|nr:hypothetical protein [Chloroflexota bacterium]